MSDWINGDWYTAPRGWRDVARCLFGFHRPAMRGEVRFSYVERCSCGAISMGGGRSWLEGRPFWRKPRGLEPTRLETFEMYQRRVEGGDDA